MPIGAKPQVFTVEEKFAHVLRIINNIRNQHDQTVIRDFILELSKRYIDKDKELQKYVSPAVKSMNAFETEYLERVIKEFSIQ